MSQQSYVSDALSLGAVPPPSFIMSQQSYVSDALSLGAAPPPSFTMSQQSYVSMLYLLAQFLLRLLQCLNKAMSLMLYL